MQDRGIKRKSNTPLSRNTWAGILHNVFYIGIIHLKRSQEYFPGLHKPLVSKALFDQVQSVMSSRMCKVKSKDPLTETFIFRKLLKCAFCHRTLSGERQKHHIYYRCHTRSCPQKTIREERVRAFVRVALKKFELDPCGDEGIQEWLADLRLSSKERIVQNRSELSHRLEEIRTALQRLTDSLIDDAIGNVLFMNRKNDLVTDYVETQRRLENLETDEQQDLINYESAINTAQNAVLTFSYGTYNRKRELLQSLFERITVSHKRVLLTIRERFQILLPHKREH